MFTDVTFILILCDERGRTVAQFAGVHAQF
jgi:hypothetical protein